MILRGVIENTFGGALCFRGFAKIGDLALISSSDKTYQRDVNDNRTEDILDFLQNGKYRFFSELTFGLQVPDESAIPNIINGKRCTFSNSIKLEINTKDFKDYLQSDKFDSPLLRRISLEFPDKEYKYLSRIDGNHRLSAVDSLDASNPKDFEKLNYLVSFCIIIQQESDDAKKHEHAYFHLINSKSVKLTSEENLKAIFSNALFSDAELIEIIGKNALDVKDLIEYFDNFHFENLFYLINENQRTFALTCSYIFSYFNEPIDTQKIISTLHFLNTEFSTDNKLSKISNFNILICLMYYKITNPTFYEKFKEWVLKNIIYDIKKIKANNIIEIYNKLISKKIYKLFVAMPYWSHGEVNEYNSLFKEICSKVSEKAKINLELIPIMRFRGKSQRIDQRLLDCINECDIFVANITGNNLNVVFEVGYADHKGVPIILLKEESDYCDVPFDMDKLQYLPYKKEIYYNDIKTKLTGNILAILTKDFNIID
ncbi:MAG: hypothetical protein HYU67_04790 [Flavobacteriia bacterium]|nr:hypothetical protein [Flavobacteriia bacterium]